MEEISDQTRKMCNNLSDLHEIIVQNTNMVELLRFNLEKEQRYLNSWHFFFVNGSVLLNEKEDGMKRKRVSSTK